MAANRLKLLSKELYEQLAAADDAICRRVAAVVVDLAMDTAAVTTGREEATAALNAGQYGDSELRQWLLKASKDAAMASHEAEELDGNRAEAERTWKLARAYETAYQALAADATHAAGEALYEVAVLVGQDRALAVARQVLSDES
ncbi:hypothetical protein [Fodinicola acaciae]|uniref:hypothetical protein n=1 Tax=Fodinicola acaciae TaxID=2681555 RepID=UPI0013D81163|nr:hypothetical protein [Fodinicola acaciae]